MERAMCEDGVIYFGEQEFKGLMLQLIRGYRFQNDNKQPTKIVLPSISEVQGVTIEQEVKDAVSSG